MAEFKLDPLVEQLAAAQSRINALLEEVEGLRKDAERYRCLRDVSTTTWRSFQDQWRMPRDKCDAVIDAEYRLASLSSGRSGSGEVSNG